jgi:putative oxidoreductase
VSYLILLGRILYGGFFVLSGSRHFTRLSAMAPYAASKRVPAPKFAVLGAGLIAVLGGLSIMLGLRPQCGVLLLVIFLVPVSLMMHNFWADPDPQSRQFNEVQFSKNLALLGAALIFLAIPEPWELSLKL